MALKKLLKLLSFSVALFFTLNSSAFAAKGFGCDGVAGAVIFKDSLYGAATGILVAALVVASQDDRSNSAKTVANGGLGGTVLGLGLGILEVSTRDCYQPSRSGSRGLKGTPMVSIQNDRIGAGVQISFTWH